MELSTWLYVIVVNSCGNEQLLGQVDYKKNESFIPTFKDKIAAQKWLDLFSKEIHKNYEIQAIIYEDLKQYASQGKASIVIINKKGIIETSIPF